MDGQIKKIGEKIKAQEALIKGGDDYDWALEPRTAIIAKLKREQSGLENQLQGLASGGYVVNRPTYLPSSGLVIGEHSSWSGRGAYSGGIPDGPPELIGSGGVIPLHQASEFIDPMGRSVAGAVMNQLAMERISDGAGGGSAPTIITDNSTTVQNNDNSTRIPSPGGFMLPDEGREFVSKIG